MTAASNDFKVYLRVEDIKKNVLAEDAGVGMNPRTIKFKVPATGGYRVLVSGADGKAGDFSISIREAGPDDLKPAPKGGEPAPLIPKGGDAPAAGAVANRITSAANHPPPNSASTRPSVPRPSMSRATVPSRACSTVGLAEDSHRWPSTSIAVICC